MNYSNYSRLLVKYNTYPIYGSNNPWDQVLLQVTEPEKYKHLHISFHGRHMIDCPNHPLVNKGIAYWTTDTTLCLGYFLKQMPTIYRPIFSHKREKQINKFLDNIPIVVNKRKKYLIFVEMMRIRKIPSVIINEIMQFI